MFQKTKLKKSYLGAIGMSLVLLLVNTLGLLLGTGVGQITPPATDSWKSYAIAPDIGNGTESHPWKISKPEHLAWLISNGGDSYSILVKDLDMSAHKWTAALRYGSAHFYGEGHTISNLTDALFNLTSKLYVYDLVLENISINSSESYVGAVAYYASTNSEIKNVTVTSGTIVGVVRAGGIVGSFNGTMENCVNNAKVIATSYDNSTTYGVGGLVGEFTGGNITNCVNTGDVIGDSTIGGLCGNCTGNITNSYAECTITGNNEVGGIAGDINSASITNCGFKGDIVVNSTTPTKIGIMAGDRWASSTLANCFGVGEIMLLSCEDNIGTHPFGAPTDGNWESCYVYIKTLTKNMKVFEKRKYKTGTEETEPFTDFAYHKNINGGFPFPKTLFAVGQFIDSDVMGYLEEYGFSTPPVIKNDGTHYYVELGEYPQTYVGDSLNATLKSWYTSNNPSSVDSYTNDKGTSADTITHYAYSYNGNKYVRVISSVMQGSYKTQDESTTLRPNQEYWFKVEPIKWWVLNYTDVQNGANPIVLAEQGLTANVTWNKSQSDQKLWASKSNIRTWLNSTFYNDAFSEVKDDIQTTTVKNNSSSSNIDGSGTTTNDNVWLLSYGEAGGGTAGQYSENRYFNDSPSRLCSPTDYALVNNCYMYVSTSYPTEIRKNGGSCYWWLRSAGTSGTYYAQSVSTSGSLYDNNVSYSNYAVRPALTLTI